MSPYIYLSILISYFIVILILSFIVSRNNRNSTFYNGDKKSPWFIVAFGMIGTTISGVTFISVPGEVGTSSFYYFQFVLGNVIGYILIASLLLPYYYKKKVVSIYSILEDRMGHEGYLTTSGFFIISKIIGASFRLFLASTVIHLAISQPIGIPFGISVIFCLSFIWLYTFRTGVKTVVWSDTLQTLVLLAAAFSTIIVIFHQLNESPLNILSSLTENGKIKILNFDWKSPYHFLKQFIAGIFMTLALNGFDQDIVQKNLTCKNGNLAKKNMLWFSVFFGIASFLFLFLGALLYYYAEINGIHTPEKTDQLYPLLALNYFSRFIAVMFILGITASAFSSADSAITSLTIAFCVDFLKINEEKKNNSRITRTLVHLAFTTIIFTVIMLFYYLNDESVIVSIFKAAGYTYGPILGIFIFSFFINRKPGKYSILPTFIASPLITYLITLTVTHLSDGYKFGFELIIINSLITIFILYLFSSTPNKQKPSKNENRKKLEI